MTNIGIKPEITRIAPSPTGLLHIGTARTAYFNWLIARATKGHFILRIDDTDHERNTQEATNLIIQVMKWLGLDYDDMFFQSKRQKDNYLGPANKLVACGYAKFAENGAILLKWHDWMGDPWHDTISGVMPYTQTFINQTDGLCLVRGGDKLGQPVYQYASIIDDYDYGVTRIVRGTDHISNTFKQVAIWRALQRLDDRDSHPVPSFSHIGLVFKDGKKMSKRDGAASMASYIEEGYKPEALLSFMLRMGWGPNEPRGCSKELIKANSCIDRKRALQMFLTEGKMSNVNCNFDQARLDWLQRRYSATAKAA